MSNVDTYSWNKLACVVNTFWCRKFQGVHSSRSFHSNGRFSGVRLVVWYYFFCEIHSSSSQYEILVGCDSTEDVYSFKKTQTNRKIDGRCNKMDCPADWRGCYETLRIVLRSERNRRSLKKGNPRVHQLMKIYKIQTTYEATKWDL